MAVKFFVRFGKYRFKTVFWYLYHEDIMRSPAYPDRYKVSVLQFKYELFALNIPAFNFYCVITDRSYGYFSTDRR